MLQRWLLLHAGVLGGSTMYSVCMVPWQEAQAIGPAAWEAWLCRRGGVQWQW